MNECGLQYVYGTQPWTDYAANATGGRRLQTGNEETTGGGSGTDEILGVCDRLTECSDLQPGFDCTPCPDGYAGTGQTGCALDDDECAVDIPPCDVLTDCLNTIGSFECTRCPDGYSGKGEEECLDIDECALNNGFCDVLVICTNSIGSFECGDCPVGFVFQSVKTTQGTDGGCVDIDECELESSFCGTTEQGKCVNGDNTYECDCNDGWSGVDCTDAVAICGALDDCSDFARCEDNGDGTHTCICHVGYDGSGQECVDIDECNTSPCQNGGVCLESSVDETVALTDYKCVCGEEFFGPHCQGVTDVNECRPNPCDHGTCAESGGDLSVPLLEYRCSCSSGWLGETCDIRDNLCEPNPCDNGGLCCYAGSTPLQNSYCNFHTWAWPLTEATGTCTDGIATDQQTCEATPAGVGDSFTCKCVGIRYIGDTCNIDACGTVDSSHAGLVIGSNMCHGMGCHAYLGCWLDNAVSPQFAVTANFAAVKDYLLEPESCINYCSMQGYLFAGLKTDTPSGTCLCGDSYGNNGLAQHMCDKLCPGDGKTPCGGKFATSVYQTTCEGTNKISAADLQKIFQMLDDNDDDTLDLQESLDLYDGKHNSALELPDCDGNMYPSFWLGDQPLAVKSFMHHPVYFLSNYL